MRAGIAGIAALGVALAIGASAQGPEDARPILEASNLETTVRQLATDLSTVCPLADPGDQTALDACRQALFRSSLLRQRLGAILLWGRPHSPPGTSLKETSLTQFGPEVWTGLYAPLFMFDGTSRLAYDEGERVYRATLGALFRNALDPGQYPYPFWHNAKKWNDYQKANTFVLWIAPSGTIVAAQFTNDGEEHIRLTSRAVTRPPFDGHWMWTDAKGETQPAPALFHGLFAEDNPYLRELEARYRDFADALRKGHCNGCHAPDNPSHTKRLVLLQTPAHAASEIKRLMRVVRDNDMPLDDSLVAQEVDADTRAALLDYGAAFEETVDAARAWEQSRAAGGLCEGCRSLVPSDDASSTSPAPHRSLKSDGKR
jgi:hypothetical protein